MAFEEQERRHRLFSTATINNNISQCRFPTIKHIHSPFDSIVSLDCPLYTRVKQAPIWDHACTGHFEFITHRPGTEEWAQHLNGRHGAVLTLLVQLASRLVDKRSGDWPDPVVPSLEAPASDAPGVHAARTRETIQREVDRSCCKHACKVGSCCAKHACHSCSSSDSEGEVPSPQRFPARPTQPECPFGCSWASQEPVTEASKTAAAIAAAVSEGRPQSLADRMFQQLRASRLPPFQPPTGRLASPGHHGGSVEAHNTQDTSSDNWKGRTSMSTATSELHPGSSRSDQLLVHLASCHLPELQFMLSYAHELATQACLPAITQQHFRAHKHDSDSCGGSDKAPVASASSGLSPPAVKGEGRSDGSLTPVTAQAASRDDGASTPGRRGAPVVNAKGKAADGASSHGGTDAEQEELSTPPTQPAASQPTPSNSEHPGSQPSTQQQQSYPQRQRRTLEMIQYDVDVMCCTHACKVGACCPNHIHHSMHSSAPGYRSSDQHHARKTAGEVASSVFEALAPVQLPPKPSTGCPFLLRATTAARKAVNMLELHAARSSIASRQIRQPDNEQGSSSDTSHDDEALDEGCSPCDGAWDTFVRGKELEAAAHILSHHIPELVAAAKHNTQACRRTLETLPLQVPPHLGPPYKGHCYQPGCHLSYTSLPWALMHQAVMHPWQVLRGAYLKQERKAREAALMNIVCPMASGCHGMVKRTHRLARHVALAHPEQLEVLATAVAGLSSAFILDAPSKQPPTAESAGSGSQGKAEVGAGRPAGTSRVQQAPEPPAQEHVHFSCALCKVLETVSALGLPATSVSQGYRRFSGLREHKKVHQPASHSPTTHEHNHQRQHGKQRSRQEQGREQPGEERAAAPGLAGGPASPTAATPVKLTQKEKAAARERVRVGPWESVEHVKQHILRYHEGMLVALAAYVHGLAHGHEGGKCPFATAQGDRLSGSSATPQSAYSMHAGQAAANQEMLRKTCPGSHTRYEFHTVEDLLKHSCGDHAEHLLQVLQVAILLGGAANMSVRPHCPLGCTVSHDRVFMDQYSVLHHLLHGHGKELQQAADRAQVNVGVTTTASQSEPAEIAGAPAPSSSSNAVAGRAPTTDSKSSPSPARVPSVPSTDASPAAVTSKLVASASS